LALHAEHRGDPAGAVRGADVGGGQRQPEGVGIARDDAARELDLLELHARIRSAAFARDVDRPELPAEPAGAQPRDVGVAGGTLPQVVGDHVTGGGRVVAHRDRQVVVAVDQDRAAQQAACMAQRLVLGGLAGRRCRGWRFGLSRGGGCCGVGRNRDHERGAGQGEERAGGDRRTEGRVTQGGRGCHGRSS